jgi:hypothetical protein
MTLSENGQHVRLGEAMGVEISMMALCPCRKEFVCSRHYLESTLRHRECEHLRKNMNSQFYQSASYVSPGGIKAEERRRQEQWDGYQRQQQGMCYRFEGECWRY